MNRLEAILRTVSQILSAFIADLNAFIKALFGEKDAG